MQDDVLFLGRLDHDICDISLCVSGFDFPRFSGGISGRRHYTTSR
jgi:hypothetical protein